jgi:hypothetical protein
MNRWLAILAPVTTFGMLSGGRKPAAAHAPSPRFHAGKPVDKIECSAKFGQARITRGHGYYADQTMIEAH